MDIKFLTQENEIQKLYSKFGLVVPVGDLETGKAPAIQPLPAQATQTSVTFSFNVMSGADITAIEYKVNDGEAVSVTPQKGVVTVELSDLDYNSGPYEIELTVTNETGDTSVTQTADLVPYTDWATANEVLEGNKFIGEDGQEAVGTYIPESGPGTGGATVLSCTIEYVQDPNYGEIPRCAIVLDTMPEDIDTENNHYAVGIFALCYTGGQYEPFEDLGEHLADISHPTPADFDLENNTIYNYFCGFPQDQDYQAISSTSGYVVLYEDSLVNPIYKWPCTITTPTNSQQ